MFCVTLTLSQIMYFLVNASLPKLLDVATSNWANWPKRQQFCVTMTQGQGHTMHIFL